MDGQIKNSSKDGWVSKRFYAQGGFRTLALFIKKQAEFNKVVVLLKVSFLPKIYARRISELTIFWQNGNHVLILFYLKLKWIFPINVKGLKKFQNSKYIVLVSLMLTLTKYLVIRLLVLDNCASRFVVFIEFGSARSSFRSSVCNSRYEVIES